MYWQPSVRAEKIPVNRLSRLAISALIIATIWLGVYPRPILNALKSQDTVTKVFRDHSLNRG
jgi:NADH:ubiquinone oxidoreductase subunit 4 (subunit M)